MDKILARPVWNVISAQDLPEKTSAAGQFTRQETEPVTSATSQRLAFPILDGHDQWLMENGRKKEKPEEWRTTNASALSLVRKIQALGIQ